MIVQLHWQNKANPEETKLLGQGTTEDFDERGDFHEWVQDLLSRHKDQCPDGWQPYVCYEGDPGFWRMKLAETNA